jgi:hypothetical protein
MKNKSREEVAVNRPCSILDTAITAVKRILELIEAQRLPLEAYFPIHKHSIGSCDGYGAFNICSLFAFGPSTNMHQMGFITCVCIRVHDNIRNTLFLIDEALPAVVGDGSDNATNKLTLDQWYNKYLINDRNCSGTVYRKAPYAQCKKLVTECLLRMDAKKKVLVGRQDRTVVRLFGLRSEDLYQNNHLKTPNPAPAPTVEDLWLTIARPEYYCFDLVSDLNQVFGMGYGERNTIAEQDFDQAITCIISDLYRQERFILMLDHMAMWHMLESNEEEVSSWLLWEKSSLMEHPIGHPETAAAMRSNAILQLIINRYFTHECGEILVPVFPMLCEYGNGKQKSLLCQVATLTTLTSHIVSLELLGLTNYILYKQHLIMTGKVPPSFILTASVAQKSHAISSKDVGHGNDTVTDLERTIKSLQIKKTCCALCGSTRSTNGVRLQVCSRCNSVAYCCLEHQKIHWKSGGHKQQCAV